VDFHRADMKNEKVPYMDGMKRRTLISLPVLALFLALPAQAGIIPIAKISAYLNATRTAKSKFTQINGDGSISTGTLYIQRPGRMRFEYDPPDAALVMAGGGKVAIFDLKSNEPPQQFPLKRTPLSVILAKNVDLGQANMITAHVGDDTTTTITAQDPKHPEIGHIQLVFTDNPVELRQWVITDEAGSQTTVILGDTVAGLKLSSDLFSVPLEIQRLTPDR